MRQACGQQASAGRPKAARVEFSLNSDEVSCWQSVLVRLGMAPVSPGSIYDLPRLSGLRYEHYVSRLRWNAHRLRTLWHLSSDTRCLGRLPISEGRRTSCGPPNSQKGRIRKGRSDY